MTQRQTIQTLNGEVIFTVIHNGPLVSEIHKGGPDGEILGVVKQGLGGALIGKQSLDIQSPSGETIATAKGDFINSEFEVKAKDGTDIAKAIQNEKGGIAEGIVSMIKHKYTLHIVRKDVIPTLTLLGFLVVLERILS